MQLFVESLSGEQVSVDVSDGATAQDVLDAVQAPRGASLAAAGAPLAAAAPIFTAAASPFLRVRLPLRGGMTIKVKTLTGREIEIDIEPSDTVQRIKERLEEKEGIAPDQQRLIFSGKQMNDDKPVAEYGIEGGSVLHLVIALRGGA